MSAARTAFLDRLSLLRAGLSEPVTTSGNPTEIKRNGIASVFRNGLAILIYATTESFIRERTAEILCSFNNMAVKFGGLPEKLRSAVTMGALKGVLARAKYETPSNRVSWVLSKLSPIAQASVNVAALSEFSFAHEHSNVSADEVAEILTAFGISSGWTCITGLSKRVGLGGIPDYKTAFEEMAKRRHSAAHDVATHTAHGDLLASLDAALGVCIGFDILLSEACGRLNRSISSSGAPFDSQIALCILTHHPKKNGHVREQTEKSKNPQKLFTRKVYADLLTGRTAIMANTTARREHLIEWDLSGKPQNWANW